MSLYPNRKFLVCSFYYANRLANIGLCQQSVYTHDTLFAAYTVTEMKLFLDYEAHERYLDYFRLTANTKLPPALLEPNILAKFLLLEIDERPGTVQVMNERYLKTIDPINHQS